MGFYSVKIFLVFKYKNVAEFKYEIFIHFIPVVHTLLKIQRAIYILENSVPMLSNVSSHDHELFIVLEYESEIWTSQRL